VQQLPATFGHPGERWHRPAGDQSGRGEQDRAPPPPPLLRAGPGIWKGHPRPDAGRVAANQGRLPRAGAAVGPRDRRPPTIILCLLPARATRQPPGICSTLSTGHRLKQLTAGATVRVPPVGGPARIRPSACGADLCSCGRSGPGSGHPSAQTPRDV